MTIFDDDPFAVDTTIDSDNASFFIAASALKKLQVMDDMQQNILRISVHGGGCSGFQYAFSFSEQASSNDIIIKEDGVTVAIDYESIQYLQGSTLVYLENLMGSYFSIENPQATASCGCGTSFSI